MTTACRSTPARRPKQRLRALPHPRLLPADRGDRVRRPPRSRTSSPSCGRRGTPSARGGSSTATPTPRWRRKSARAISDGQGLMDGAPLPAPGGKTLLRFLTCGSVDDGKSTLIGRLLYDSEAILADQLETLQREFEEIRHHRRRYRPGAVARRPRGRTPAGHHHRCRLPSVPDQAARLHRRRHAGPRAVHAQHGDRRLDRRSGAAARRCEKGRRRPDPPPFADLLAARHPPRRARGQQARPRRFRLRDLRRHRQGVSANSPPISASRRCRRSRSQPASATMSPAARRACPGTTGRR